MEEVTTGIISVPLAQLVAILATEVEEEAVVMAAEAAEAVVAMGIIPAVIVCPSMESMFLIPSTVSPHTNGTSMATMVEDRFSVCMTVPIVNNLPLVEAEAVKEDARAVQLRPWRPGFKLSRQLPLLPHR